jgi:bifunctional DNA-binding transcriptional regulator/antitoxin component of YhaV-PrlF toxin-antitoxin module
MITRVEDRNLVAIPQAIAEQHGIKPGGHLDWQPTETAGVLVVKVLPDYRALASGLMGAGRKFLPPGSDPIADLIQERETDDLNRNS